MKFTTPLKVAFVTTCLVAGGLTAHIQNGHREPIVVQGDSPQVKTIRTSSIEGPNALFNNLRSELRDNGAILNVEDCSDGNLTTSYMSESKVALYCTNEGVGELRGLSQAVKFHFEGAELPPHAQKYIIK